MNVSRAKIKIFTLVFPVTTVYTLIEKGEGLFMSIFFKLF